MSDFPTLPYPWQQDEWQQLCALIGVGRLPHALMLTGPAGIGKHHLALALAQRLLCEAPVMDTPCGKCRSCLLNRAQTHPDLLWLTPEEEGKAIKVDQVRELSETLGKTAQQGGYKVVILAPADAMNTNAANALLKSLEEPADKTLLLLISTNPSSVLPTIRSRCQLRLMPLPPREQVLHWLRPLLAGQSLSAEALVEAAEGAPLKALSYLESDELEQRTQWLEQLGRVSLGQLSPLEVAAQWQNSQVGSLLEWLVSLVQGLVRWQLGVSDTRIQTWPQALREQLLDLSPALVHRYLEKLLQTRRLWLSGANPNKQLLLEELLLDWSALLRAGKSRRPLASGHS
jgi:DNA polymerase-3 subunit delta'